MRWVLWIQVPQNQERIMAAFALDSHPTYTVTNIWECGCIRENLPQLLLLLKRILMPCLCITFCVFQNIFTYFILLYSLDPVRKLLFFILNKKCISLRVNNELVTETKPESRFLYFYSKTVSIKSHLNFNVLVSLPSWIKIMTSEKNSNRHMFYK